MNWKKNKKYNMKIESGRQGLQVSCTRTWYAQVHELWGFCDFFVRSDFEFRISFDAFHYGFPFEGVSFISHRIKKELCEREACKLWYNYYRFNYYSFWFRLWRKTFNASIQIFLRFLRICWTTSVGLFLMVIILIKMNLAKMLKPCFLWA